MAYTEVEQHEVSNHLVQELARVRVEGSGFGEKDRPAQSLELPWGRASRLHLAHGGTG